jgi:hypothetical protein
MTLQRLLIVGSLAALCGAVFAYIPVLTPRDALPHVASAIGCAFLAVLAVALLYRLLVRRPTLVVGPDGIVEHGSLYATGAGLLGWDEIWSVAPAYRSSGPFKQRVLSISVFDPRAVRQRMPLLKRAANTLLAPGSPSFVIVQDMLDEPVTDVSARIKCYVKTHAPEHWLGYDGEDDGTDEGGDGPNVLPGGSPQ